LTVLDKSKDIPNNLNVPLSVSLGPTPNLEFISGVKSCGMMRGEMRKVGGESLMK
jgi:hypothetical protein